MSVPAHETERFRYYTRFIRNIDPFDSPLGFRQNVSWHFRKYSVQPAILQIVPFVVEDRPLLPSLEKLSWWPMYLGYFDTPHIAMPLFLAGPPLRRLELHYEGLMDSTTKFVTSDLIAVSLSACDLEAVTLYMGTIEWGAEIPIDSEGLARVLTACSHLRCLEVIIGNAELSFKVTERLAGALSSSPRLTSLTLDIANMHLDNPRLSLASLKHLKLASWCSTVAAFFRAASLPNLQTLSLRLYRFQQDQYDESVECLTRSPSPSPLCIVRIEIAHTTDPTSLLRLVQPFFQFHKMEQFNVCADYLTLDGGHTVEISKNWPKLTEFLCQYYDIDGYLWGMPAVVLEQFAANCPDLQRLSLPCIDDSGLDTDPYYEPRGEPHRRLKTLLIGRADVECTQEHFARYLMKLFPELHVPENPDGCVRSPYDMIDDLGFWNSLRVAVHGSGTT